LRKVEDNVAALWNISYVLLAETSRRQHDPVAFGSKLQHGGGFGRSGRSNHNGRRNVVEGAAFQVIAALAGI